MTRPRSQIVSLEATPYYHCIARCVRRAWLCGTDAYTGQNFDHRKRWLLARLKLLGDVFAIDIAAYAIMSSHYHVVLHVDAQRSQSWTESEVIARWTRLYSGPELVKRHVGGERLTASERILLSQIISRWRQRLADISWFMRCLNEYLARRANAEDGCKGRFWEARFKSQALLDDAALLSCMAYVDLNPVRAGIAMTLKQSNYTSIQDRIRDVASDARDTKQNSVKPRLMPFAETTREQQLDASIPFKLRSYIELVDWTGRIARPDKKGFIPACVPKILENLHVSTFEWKWLVLDVQKKAITMLHGLAKVEQLHAQLARRKAA